MNSLRQRPLLIALIAIVLLLVAVFVAMSEAFALVA
jgi:hypothetical protein